MPPVSEAFNLLNNVDPSSRGGLPSSLPSFLPFSGEGFLDRVPDRFPQLRGQPLGQFSGFPAPRCFENAVQIGLPGVPVRISWFHIREG